MSATATHEDIEQLRESIRGALGTDDVDSLPDVDAGWRARWPTLTALGISGLCVPAERGGLGHEVESAVAVAEELGAALHGSPYAALTASAAALASTDEAAGASMLAGVLGGEIVCTFGALDRQRARARVVDGAPEADALLLVDGADRLLLFTDRGDWRVDAETEPLDVTRSVGGVTVDPAAGRHLGDGSSARLVHRLLLAADALGCAKRSLDRTVAYAGQRIAFGKPIGAFQAVQHRLVEHAIRARGMTLLVREAARSLAAGDADAPRMVALAALSVSANAGPLLYDLLQLTGAIGFTWEYGLHYFLRRAHHDARLGGNPRAAARSVAELEGWST